MRRAIPTSAVLGLLTALSALCLLLVPAVALSQESAEAEATSEAAAPSPESEAVERAVSAGTPPEATSLYELLDLVQKGFKDEKAEKKKGSESCRRSGRVPDCRSSPR